MKWIPPSDIKIGNIYWYYESYEITKYVCAVRPISQDVDTITFEDITPCLICDANVECSVQKELDNFSVSSKNHDAWTFDDGQYIALFKLTEEELINTIVIKII